MQTADYTAADCSDFVTAGYIVHHVQEEEDIYLTQNMTIVAIQNISNRASCQKTLRSTKLTT